MGIKSYNPYTPSRRNMTGSDFSEITKSTPEKSLLVSFQKNAGRNNQGKITVRHHGGGNRQKYRMIDFKRNKEGVPAQVIGIEYDPNRTANIALICYADGEKSYILAPAGLTDGMTVMKKFKDIRNFKTTVILLTRNNEYEYNEEYLKYGFSDYLLKPINKDKLFEIIDKYLK